MKTLFLGDFSVATLATAAARYDHTWASRMPGNSRRLCMSVATEVKQGHACHIQDMDEVLGLRGGMPRPIKIAMLGAGSMFTPRLVNDVLQIPGADRGEIALVDLDEDRLKTMHALIRK